MANCNMLPIDLNTLADELKQRLFVKVSHYGGWKPDLLIDKLSVREEKLLVCYVCHGIMRNAVYNDKHTSCKVCARRMHYFASKNTNARSIINELQIKCPLTLNEEGCDWTGAIANLTAHFSSCLYYPVQCPLKCFKNNSNIYTIVPRKKLEFHMKKECPNRKSNCDFCHRSIQASIMNIHLSKCEAFPQACPNNCINPHNNKPTLVKRGEMNNHIEMECANVEIDCPYLPHGCNVKLLRKDLASHEKDYMPRHLGLMNGKLLEKDKTIYSLKLQLTNETQRIDTRLEEFRNLIGNQYKLIKQTENQCQSMCTNLKSIISERDSKLNLVIQQFKCSNLSNYFDWTIEDVRGCIRNKDVLTSDMFYACQGKFYCTAEFRQNSNDSLSFFICIANGEFDNYLNWPLSISCRYILLNLDNPNDHIFMEGNTMFNNPSLASLQKYGFTEFVNFSKLTHEGKYRQNDKITLRVEIRSKH